MGPDACGECEENPLQDWPEHLGWRSVRSLLSQLWLWVAQLHCMEIR